MSRLFDRRIRGFRLIELTMFAVLAAMVFGVYLAKTWAGRDRQEIARIERQIAAEQRRIRLLKAEVAHLEQPERLGRLSSDYLGLKPVDAGREAPAESLEEIARTRADPQPLPPGLAPKPTEPAPDAVAAPASTTDAAAPPAAAAPVSSPAR